MSTLGCGIVPDVTVVGCDSGGHPMLQPLVTTAMTTLSSKIVNVHKRKMAQIAVDAVMAVANLERHDVNFDMIKVGMIGSRPRIWNLRVGSLPVGALNFTNCLAGLADGLSLPESYGESESMPISMLKHRSRTVPLGGPSLPLLPLLRCGVY